MADMLSRAQFDEEEEMVSEEEEVSEDFFELAQLSENRQSTLTIHEFNEDDYDGDWLPIGNFLGLMTTNASETKEEASRIRKKAY